MSTTKTPWDDLAADLTDAALEVVSRYPARSPSVEVELSLWRRLAGVLQRTPYAPREALAFLLAEAGRRSALAHLPGAPAGLTVELRRAFRPVLHRGRHDQHFAHLPPAPAVFGR
jgi:hypothetical protein